MDKYKIICIVFSIIGTLLCLIGIYIYNQYKTFQKYGIKTQGIVKDMEKKQTHNLSGANEIKYTYYFYTIEYQGTNGDKICSKSKDGIKKKYSINENVNILYNSKNKTEFIIVGEDINKRLYILFIILGVFFILISIFFFVKK
ncbi:DUF3592 domain-containing protein [Chryseobacterium sp. PMSZPI]|uniref:DUF3592 domain-containing protein n=1 Tax=Chryseobacterium sp. PMSZPI TaxID=1033900 RepID=UPI0039A07011